MFISEKWFLKNIPKVVINFIRNCSTEPNEAKGVLDNIAYFENFSETSEGNVLMN